jgi:hypothetical protein
MSQTKSILKVREDVPQLFAGDGFFKPQGAETAIWIMGILRHDGLETESGDSLATQSRGHSCRPPPELGIGIISGEGLGEEGQGLCDRIQHLTSWNRAVHSIRGGLLDPLFHVILEIVQLKGTSVLECQV